MKRMFLLVALLFVAGCCRKPVNLTVSKRKVTHHYETCCYQDEVKHTVQKALEYFKQHRFTKQSTVIFDVDDTLLSNYCEMKQISFGFVPKLNHEWILKSTAPAVPSIKSLYDYCVEHNFNIVILSGRKENEREATIKNLYECGFTNFSQVLLRNTDEESLSAREYKAQRRRELVKQGLHIIGCVGDQWSDLQGGNTGHKVKIPNYTYIID